MDNIALQRRRRVVAGGQVTLAVRLAELLAAADPDRNLVFSPLSIHAALSLGSWDRPFMERDTKRRPFYRLDGGAIHRVPYMSPDPSSDSHQFVAMHDGFKVLKLNYKRDYLGRHVSRYAMAIFLPDARDGLRGLVGRIASRPGFLHEHLPSGEPVPVGELRVPRFRLCCARSVGGVLEQVGLRLPFIPGLADLSGMVDRTTSSPAATASRRCSGVVHKAVIEVNEEGTEAAPATFGAVSTGCAPARRPWTLVSFLADHPFAYFILDEASLLPSCSRDRSQIGRARMDFFEALQRHRAVSGGQAALAVRLAEQLAAANLDRNLVFSPLSIHAALSLLAADAGGVWCDAARPLEPAYRDAVVGKFKAEATTVDFKNKTEEAREQINEWTRQVTRGLIDAVLPPGSVGASTAAVLGNAIYFKGSWERPFKGKNTKRKPFYRLDRRRRRRRRALHRVAAHDGFKVLELMYRAVPRRYSYSDDDDGHGDGGGDYSRYSMVVFLPDARDGLRGLVERIASRPGFLHEHVPSQSVPVGDFRVPKFKVSFAGSVAGIVERQGLRLPFSSKLADLSAMAEDDGSGMPLFVSDVLHRAVIEVNEEGSEASAATMVDVMIGCSMVKPPPPPPPVDFVADHPFAYFIVEQMSRAVVFAGHVIDPTME
uniref:Serpin domain-containing protein n=1 Tax=Oryza barthii TaxID=65489 RepID=A0A0D3HJS2_9ORYZ